MNEALFRFIVTQIVTLGTVFLGIWGALQAWKIHNDRKLEETKVKAKESNAGQTAIKDLNERFDKLFEKTENIQERFEERHQKLFEQLGQMNKSMMDAIVNLKK